MGIELLFYSFPYIENLSTTKRSDIVYAFDENSIFKNSVDVAGTEMYSHCQIFGGDECFRHNTYRHLFFEGTLLLIINVLSKNVLCFWGKHDPFQDKRVSC